MAKVANVAWKTRLDLYDVVVMVTVRVEAQDTEEARERALKELNVHGVIHDIDVGEVERVVG